MTTAEIQQLVVSKANQYGVNPNIALAQMARESGWRQDVIFGPFVGGAGEQGISQFTPGTWARFGSGPHTNAYDPNLALDAWGNYMVYLLAMFNGDYTKALTGYNGGEGHVSNPGKYGPPSAAALAYGQDIAAQAGFGPGSVVGLDQIDVSPTGEFPLGLVMAGLGALILILVLRD